MRNNRQKYRQFCSNEPAIPIFSKDWWLDAVCGKKNWDVALVEQGGTIIASLPYVRRKMLWLTILGMPKLTQTLGPRLRISPAKYAKQLSQQKKLMTQLIEQLPPYDLFYQNFHYSITGWLPFYWKGFEQTTRYTYLLDGLDNPSHLWDQLLPKVRTDIKKAQNRFQLQIDSNPNIDLLMDVVEQTFRHQKIAPPWSRNLVRRLDRACENHNARKMFFAKDGSGQIHAAVYVVWDAASAYYLMGGSPAQLRNSGANSLCLWEAIKFAATITKTFDFEGSMLEPVERFFRGFGAKQVPYFQIRAMSKQMQLLMSARTIFNTFLSAVKGE